MGWVANHDGNISLRLTGKRLLITPTGFSKPDVDDASLIIVDLDGKVLEGRKKPFSELELHLAAYRARPEVEVVLHAHPPCATAFGLAGLELVARRHAGARRVAGRSHPHAAARDAEDARGGEERRGRRRAGRRHAAGAATARSPWAPI